MSEDLKTSHPDCPKTLHREIERLTDERDEARARAVEYASIRDFAEHQHQHDRLHAEVERLQKMASAHCAGSTKWFLRAEAAEAEVARLRAALENLLSALDWVDPIDVSECAAIDAARAALAPKEASDE